MVLYKIEIHQKLTKIQFFHLSNVVKGRDVRSIKNYGIKMSGCMIA
jgi:hypothetical protein